MALSSLEPRSLHCPARGPFPLTNETTTATTTIAGQRRAGRRGRETGLFDISIRHDRRSCFTEADTPPPTGSRSPESFRDGFARSGPALSVSANSSALSNSMHVLMKHCWPAAHCQSHCCLDDWSIEGLRAFVMPPPRSDRRPLPRRPGARFESTASSSTCARCCRGERRENQRERERQRQRESEGGGWSGGRENHHRLYIGILDNVQNNVQEPSVDFFQACTTGESVPCRYLSAGRPDKRLHSSVTFVLLVIPVDSFSFGFIAGTPLAGRADVSWNVRFRSDAFVRSYNFTWRTRVATRTDVTRNCPIGNGSAGRAALAFPLEITRYSPLNPSAINLLVT